MLHCGDRVKKTKGTHGAEDGEWVGDGVRGEAGQTVARAFWKSSESHSSTLLKRPTVMIWMWTSPIVSGVWILGPYREPCGDVLEGCRTFGTQGSAG